MKKESLDSEWYMRDVEGWTDQAIKGRRVRGKWPLGWGNSSGQQDQKRANF
jgi:hypothetical protein